MRNTIGAKVFTIAILLVLLMVGATFVSSYHLSRVRDQLKLMSVYYLELDQRMSEVRAYGLNELMLFERLSSYKPNSFHIKAPAQAEQLLTEVGGCEKNIRSDLRHRAEEKFSIPAERDSVLLEVMEACGRKEHRLAAELIDVARKDPLVKESAEEAVKFTQVDHEIDDIPEAIANLHTTMQLYFRERSEGDKESIELARLQVDRDWEHFSKQINEVTIEHLHPYTTDVADKAADLERRAFLLSLGMTAIAGVLGLFFAAWLTRNLVRPVRELLLGTKAIEQGDLDIHIKVSSTDEISLLANSFNRMVGELKQKEIITETFGKYVDPRIVKGLIEDKQFSQNGDKRMMTVFFSDLEGFTAISEKFSAEGVVKLLNQYFSLMSEPIREANGIIDKYIGDAIMAFWGPPFTSPTEHPKLACLAALKQLELIKQFETMLPDLLGVKRDLPKLNMRIGISMGDVIVGSIGSEVARSYTVIGDNVNLASRLESANKNYGTNILICKEVWDMVKEDIECREIDCIRVAGKTQSIRIFEVVGLKAQLPDNLLEAKVYFESGLAAYRAQDWDVARQQFEKCQALNSQDQAAQVFLKRVESFRANPPGKDWDGNWTYYEK